MSNFFEGGKAGLTSNRQDWETPQALWDRLDERFHFTIDVAATHENAKCERHYTVEEDGLVQPWSGEMVWCNPPYDRASRKWIAKMAQEAAGGGTHRRTPSSTHGRRGISRLYLREAERPHRVPEGKAQVRARREAAEQRPVPVDAGVLQLLRGDI